MEFKYGFCKFFLFKYDDLGTWDDWGLKGILIIPKLYVGLDLS